METYTSEQDQKFLIDRQRELIKKLDDKIEQLNKQLTQKDILLDRKISQLNQIRALVEKI